MFGFRSKGETGNKTYTADAGRTKARKVAAKTARRGGSAIVASTSAPRPGRVTRNRGGV